MVQRPGEAVEVSSVGTGATYALDGSAAVQVLIDDLNANEAPDIVVLTSDGAIRLHRDGAPGGAVIDAADPSRSSIAVGRMRDIGADILSVRGVVVEAFHLDSNGAVLSVSSSTGARGRLIGALDPDKNGKDDIVIGGAVFTDGVAVDAFLQAVSPDIFDGPIQARKVACDSPCAAAGMRVASIYGEDPRDVLLHVPGATNGDLHLYVGGGLDTGTANPIALPVRDIEDFELGNVVGDSRADIVIAGSCRIVAIPGVSLSAAPVPGVPFGEPVEIPVPEGHCPTLVALLDTDGDGLHEVVSASSEDEAVVVYEHRW